MSSKKLITVFGATGNQGGSVIASILSHPELSSQYAIRGVTRDPTKPSAAGLKAKGVEPVKGDLSDPASLRTAIEGSYAVFAVTNYWETMSKSTEIAQGKAIVDAAIDSKVSHLILSTLPNVTELTDGVLKNVEHFDSKAEVSVYAESLKEKAGMVVTHFMPAYFMSNMKDLIRKDQDGQLAVTLPWTADTTHVPMIDIRSDTGKYVMGALVQGKKADGKWIQAVSDWRTPSEILKTISEVGGTPEIKFVEIPAETWAGFLPLPKHAAVELAENMTLIKDYSYYGKGTEKKQQELGDAYVLEGEKLVTWAEYVKDNGPWGK